MVRNRTSGSEGLELVSNPERRTFLGMGVGCAAPFLLGAIPGGQGILLAAPQGGRSTTDQICEHAARELLRVHGAMRGSSGVRGEHLRSIGANLDLATACVLSHEGDVDGLIRARVRERGEQAVLTDVLSRHREVAALVQQRGLTLRAELDAGRASYVFSRLVEDGVGDSLRAGRLLLNRLANRLDRTEGDRPGVVMAALRQKPGDDFLGSWNAGSLNWSAFNCGQLDALGNWLQVAAAVLAVLDMGPEAGIVALIGAIVQLIDGTVCAT
jgi:hypothetical protein